MKKLMIKVVVAAVAVALLGACGRQETLLSIAAGTDSGTWHPIGGAIGNLINRNLDGVRINVEATEGGVENVRLLGTNQADIGLCIAATALNGYRGTSPYRQSYTNLRTLISSFQLGYLHMAVLEESPLRSMEDIQGQRVAIGPSGHGSIPRQREIYQEMGLSFEDFTPIYLPFRDALQALGDRRLNAAVLYQALPAPSLIEFGVIHQYRLLPIGPEYLERLVSKYPYFVSAAIPSETYDRNQPVSTIATANVILVREEIPEEIVYGITKILLEHLEEFRSAHPSIKDFKPEMAVLGNVVPYHPGAEISVNEIGLLE